MIATPQERYDILTTKYEISAKVYFAILKLAILYLNEDDIKTSYEICQYLDKNKSANIFRCACELVSSLDVFRKERKK